MFQWPEPAYSKFPKNNKAYYNYKKVNKKPSASKVKKIERFFSKKYKSKFAILMPSGRSAINQILINNGINRSKIINVPLWTSTCLLHALTAITNVSVRNKKADGFIIVHKWGITYNIDKNIISSNEILSHNLLKSNLFPELNQQSYFLIVIDNLRYDQWLIIKPILEEYFNIEKEETYTSIIPTTTQYARNALFSGLSPLEINRRYPDKWVSEEENEGKNLHEEFFLNENLRRQQINIKSSYHKITNLNAGKKLVQQIENLKHNQLNTIVYNFVDTLSHARTDMEVIKELAEDESAYRSITRSWFKHSPLFDVLKKISATSSKVFLTTDHGTIRVKTPTKVIGPKSTNSNMRYKVSKNLTYQSKDVIEAQHPEKIMLPKTHLSSSFIFAREDKYFVYPNNYNHFAKLYNDTFQHGGISMEEMLIPYVQLKGK